MKKLFLLPVLLFLVLTSCKDEEDATPQTISEQIKGTWVTTNQTYKYYNASGQVVHEETDQTKTTFVFDGSNVTATYEDGDGMVGTYTITKNSGKDYINLTESNQTEQMEITAISGSSMSWRTEEDNAQYFHNGLQTSDHAVVTIDFSKK